MCKEDYWHKRLRVLQRRHKQKMSLIKTELWAYPKLSELIPLYGIFAYNKRYFAQSNAGIKEAIIAKRMEAYHLVISPFCLMYIISLFF